MDFVTCPSCGQVQAKNPEGVCIKCGASFGSESERIEEKRGGGSMERSAREVRRRNSAPESYSGHTLLATLFFISAAICSANGFHKYFYYKNSDYTPVNAYVGGDAYNYIINSNYMCAFFVFALVNVVLGIGILILRQMKINGDKLDRIGD